MRLLSICFVTICVLDFTFDLGTRADTEPSRRHGGKLQQRSRAPRNQRRFEQAAQRQAPSDAPDDYSGGYDQRTSSLARRQAADSAAPPRAHKNKIYGPKQDPRQYYQSEAFIREAVARHDLVSRIEMGSVFPELEPRLARARTSAPQVRTLERSSRYKDQNSVLDYDDDMCLKCPAERMLVIRAGLSEVALPPPRIQTCAGEKAPRGVRFVRARGPAFGSLLTAGSYFVSGRLSYKGQYLQPCRMAVHVASRLCPRPHHLRAACDGFRCNFTCADPSLQLSGSATLICGDDLRWSGELPVCRVQTWCHLPTPERGQLSCQSVTTANGQGVEEGARCRVRCEPGWRPAPRASSVCRRGAWTGRLACRPHGFGRRHLD